VPDFEDLVAAQAVARAAAALAAASCAPKDMSGASTDNKSAGSQHVEYVSKNGTSAVHHGASKAASINSKLSGKVCLL
jgi:hypothetical protein